MIPVKSSRFTHIGFAAARPNSPVGNLHVIFTDGTKGHYQDVPIDAFRAVRDDLTSKGSALHRHVISQGYQFVKD